MNVLASLLCGLIFGAGLVISGMTQPAKVLAFLDVLGRWDPTLAFVMVGALTVSGIGYALARGRRPVCAATQSWPTATHIDRRLIIGAVLFGTGWGMVGLCPGPALTDLASLSPRVIVFVLAMGVGVIAWEWWQSRLSADTAIANTALEGSDG